MSDYYSKYMKYKSKYLRLKKQLGGLTMPYDISFENSFGSFELIKSYHDEIMNYMNKKHNIDLSKFVTEIDRVFGVVYIKLPALYKNDTELIKLLDDYQTKSIDEQIKINQRKKTEQKLAAEDAALDAQWEEKSRRRR